MAPQKSTARSTKKSTKAAKPPIAKTKPKAKAKQGKVRRLENGLLEVERKGGRYVKLVKKNAQTPLLRFPAEIRNRIWEYALGGHTFTMKSQYTGIWGWRIRATSRKQDTFSLLRVCRQTYAECALLPYKTNTFRFPTDRAFDWLIDLTKVKQDVVSSIRFVTKRIWVMPENRLGETLITPDAFQYLPLPGLRNVHVEVRDPEHDINDQVEEVEQVKKQAEEGMKAFFRKMNQNMTVRFEWIRAPFHPI